MPLLPRLSGRFLLAGAALAITAVTASAGSNAGASFYPNDPYFAYNGSGAFANFPGQWHLVNLAPLGANNTGVDVNILGAWTAGYTGRGVVIGIIDDGVDGSHPDIAPNFRADLSKNFSQDPTFAAAPEGTNLLTEDAHGQNVAGVAAARGGNGIGTTGAAPFAQIAGMRIQLGGDQPGSPSVTSADLTAAYLWKSGASGSGTYLGEAEIQVKNNSYGASIPFSPFGSDPTTIAAIKAASTNNVIFLFAAANARGELNQQAGGLMPNGLSSSINVAALSSSGFYAGYSSWGSAVFISAPSGVFESNGFVGITTTDRAGAYGYNNTGTTPINGTPAVSEGSNTFPDANYNSGFNGTSSATPLVSGIIAIAKQAAPDMDVRMAKQALAATARITDPDDNTAASNGVWTTNAAGYHFNPDYGFGLIDATAFVNRVIQIAWVTDATTITSSANVGTLLTGSGVTKKITVASLPTNQALEGVEVNIKATGGRYYKDLALTLVSPSGTSSDLFRYNDTTDIQNAGALAQLDAIYAGPLDWTFLSNAFWGESVAGDWKLTAFDRSGAITWNSYSITFDMGAVVLENGPLTLGASVKAHSLDIDKADTVLTIPVGKSFTVTDSVNLNAGTVIVAGTLDEGSPTLSPSWDKMSKITITSGATLDALTGSTVKASRGIDILGGVFRLADGVTLNAGTGITLAYSGVLAAANDLTLPGPLDVSTGGRAVITRDATLGAVTLADNGSILAVGRDLKSSGAITVTGGDLRVGRNITTTKLTLAGGSFLPGGAAVVGTTAITGALDVSGSSILVFDVISPSNHDRITASAPTVISGGSALVNLLGGGTIHIGDTFDVITGNVTGAFNSVVTTGDHPFITLSQVPGNAGTLTAGTDFAAAAERIGGSPNQREAGSAIGRVVTAGGPNAAIFNTVAESVSGAAEAGAILNAFVPQNGLEVASSAYRTSSSVAGTYANFASRLHSGDIDSSGLWANPLFDSYSFDFVKPVSVVASNDYIPGAFEDDRSVSIWVNGNAGYTKTNASPSQNRVKSKDTSFGAAVGADFRLTPAYEDDIHAGFFVGFQSADSKQGDSGSESETETTAFAPGVYVSGITSGFELDAMVAYSLATYDLTRDIPAIGATPASKADASPGGNQAIARFGVARPFTFRKSTFSFTPTASLTYVTGEVDSYTENNGGIAGLSVEKQTYDSLQSNLGVRFQQQFDLSSVTLLPTLAVGWGHELIGQERDVGVTSSSLGAPFAYTARTPFIGRDFMTISTAVTFYVSDNTRLNIGYDGEFFRENVPVSHRASATFTVKF